MQPQKGEKCNSFLRRFIEGAKVADLPNLSPEGGLLHLFLDKCPEREEAREIKNKALEILRQKSNSGAKVTQMDLDTYMNFIKEQESSLLSRVGKPSKVMRANQSSCPICKSQEHSKWE